MNILASQRHPARAVDPFSLLPCNCTEVIVHISDGQRLADDVLECDTHRYALRLADLYVGLGGPELPS